MRSRDVLVCCVLLGSLVSHHRPARYVSRHGWEIVVGENGCEFNFCPRESRETVQKRSSAISWNGDLIRYIEDNCCSSQPYQKPQATFRSFTHSMCPFIQVPPRLPPHTEIMSKTSSVRPPNLPPIRPLCHLPFLNQEPLTPLVSRSPVISARGFLTWADGGTIPYEYTVVGRMLFGARALCRPTGCHRIDKKCPNDYIRHHGNQPHMMPPGGS